MLTLFASFLVSIIVGGCIGYLYGLLFIYQKKGALFNDSQHHNVQSLISQIFLTVMRIASIALIIWYLLPLPKIDFILVMLSFFILFWIVITQYKGIPHE
jgi:cell division protein FtsW (lipid II flippase)